MLENIRAHSLMVARIAHLIARKLNQNGMAISIPLVTSGALLHDIGKTLAIERGGDHTLIGATICTDHWMPEVAEIVAEHVRLKSYSPNGKILEKEIVYYSDKRVNHDKIVTVDERLKYILDRYGIKDGIDIRDAIRKNFKRCKQVEKKLFHHLDFGPDDLALLAIKEDIAQVF